MDRQIGGYQTSFTLTKNATSQTGNTYNISVYANNIGTALSGSINFGIVVLATNTSPASNYFWLAAGNGDKNYVSQDFWTVQKLDSNSVPPIGDAYAVSSTSFGADNATSGCANNVVGINAGWMSAYTYGHMSRTFVSTDTGCDTQIVDGVSDMFCLYYLESATLAGITDFTTTTDGKTCFGVLYGQWIVSALVLVLIQLMH